MSYLPELRQALVEAAGRQASSLERHAGMAPNARRGWRLGRWRRLALNLALGLVGTTVGLSAAGVFKRGTQVGPEVTPSPSAFEGVAIPDTVRLLALRADDPGGGPPWGMRVLRTTRGLTCVQIGRVGFGTVGVLGRDGSFGNDGRFHPLSENFLQTPFGCAPTDGRGNGFLNAFLQDTPASGMLGGRGCRVADELARRRARANTCPARDLRDVFYGLLGPDAVSITHLTASGTTRRTPTSGPEGAYLIVLPHATKGCLVPAAPRRFPKLCQVGFQGDTGGPGIPAGAISAVAYRDGHVCHVPAPGSRASLFEACPPVGFVAPRVNLPTPAQLATPISVRKIPARSYCTATHGEGVKPCGARVPAGFRRLTGGWRSLLVRISFVSRVAIPDSRSFYEFNLEMPRSVTCTTGGTSGPTDADIAAGQRVTSSMFVPYRCPGVVKGDVSYVPLVGPATSMPVTGLPGQGTAIPVGRFSFHMP
jgi:hypothetical protein